MTERKMKDGFWMLLCAACLLLSARSVQARELTAWIFLPSCRSPCLKTRRKAFPKMKAPADRAGGKRIWEVERFDADRLVLVSRPFGETRVGLRVFRGGDRLLAALGTDGGACAPLTLWQEDAPVDSCRPIRRMTRSFPIFGLRAAACGGCFPGVMFCLEDDGLDVRPLFWGLRASSTCL